jgi:hypothetical protein
MEFHLTYRGTLKANGGVQHKHRLAPPLPQAAFDALETNAVHRIPWSQMIESAPVKQA